MFIYDLAIVEDHGNYYQVVGLTKNALSSLVTDAERHIKLSAAAYKMIDDAINAGSVVRLPKTLQVDEVLPGEVNIISGSAEPLEAARSAALVKARSLVTPEMTKMSGIVLYNFMNLNNVLAAEGYFITNANREAKYIEIIETGNMDLITALEQYLAARDEIGNAASMKVRLDAFITEINKLTTVEEVVAAETKFVADFYANSSL